MAIKHALLGLLAEGPKHGYELKTAFDEAIGERWSLNIGQVYNTLNRLARDGYVVLQEEVVQETRPDRKVYAITEAGPLHTGAPSGQVDERYSHGERRQRDVEGAAPQ